MEPVKLPSISPAKRAQHATVPRSHKPRARLDVDMYDFRRKTGIKHDDTTRRVDKMLSEIRRQREEIDSIVSHPVDFEQRVIQARVERKVIATALGSRIHDRQTRFMERRADLIANRPTGSVWTRSPQPHPPLPQPHPPPPATERGAKHNRLDDVLARLHDAESVVQMAEAERQDARAVVAREQHKAMSKLLGAASAAEKMLGDSVLRVQAALRAFESYRLVGQAANRPQQSSAVVDHAAVDLASHMFKGETATAKPSPAPEPEYSPRAPNSGTTTAHPSPAPEPLDNDVEVEATEASRQLVMSAVECAILSRLRDAHEAAE
jgi:hypothetical protein